MSDDTAPPSPEPVGQPDVAPDGAVPEPGSEPPTVDAQELRDRVDLDALVNELDRIDAALPRLDDGSYFADEPSGDAPSADVASPDDQPDATDGQPTGDAAE